ncbi:MAG: RagB/SusD family nutrient uptake outer membrane protein [Pedobacter sp.]|uniref:RagB/SusD family nutrient uptake outer membrane protein n=1 Tax=Pedobacter sp. TaxID=1411316 RepID=UPI002806C9ED|nr:RagB/SusD family nutrient uptake outer membrane protein [Pedobacter sp.]MDQ8005284.1 RagB/SusD family nutrient uptake outer membrane protein [Pedobacter sp.]
MKKIYTAIIGSLVLFASCKKILEEDVRSQISDLYYTTPSGVEYGVKASYSYMRRWYGNLQETAWITNFGDEYTDGNASGVVNDYSVAFNSFATASIAPWSNMYTAINTCNSVLKAAEGVDMPAQLKNTRIGELRFLRANYFFLLVQTYGPISLPLTPTESASSVAKREPIADVYKTIIADLDFAVANLPQTTTEYGRATTWAARHSLAKVYLAKAGSTAKEATDYAKAATLAKEVIASNVYKLLPDFASIFLHGKNEEVIFSSQFDAEPLAGGSTGNLGNYSHLFFGTGYDVMPGMLRDIANGRPYNHFRPTPFMQGLYNKTIDSRFSKSFKTVWYCNRPGNYTISGKTVNMKLGDIAFIFTDYEPTQAERNAAPYTIVSPSQQTTTRFPQSSKHIDANRLDFNNVNGNKDLIIHRLGETYLIAAEALMMDGKPGEAVFYVNELRKRAAITSTDPSVTAANRLAMEVTAGQLNIDFILDERARELNGEYMRWFDLVRTGKLLERVKLYNTRAAPNIKDYHVLRPIPQIQIDRVIGGASAYPQNPGYN